MEKRVEELLKRIERDRGFARKWHPMLAQRDFEFTETWHDLVMHALYKERVLPRKVKELICVVMDAITYYEQGLRIHVRGALEHGATEEEILEALELCSILGSHYMSVHLPAFVDEVQKFEGGKEALVTGDRAKELIERLERERGVMRPWRRMLAALDPDFMEMWHKATIHALVRKGALPRKVKEIICIVMDAITYYEEGVRIHVRGALQNGASRQEVLETLELCSILGGHFMSVHLPAFEEEVQKFKGR